MSSSSIPEISERAREGRKLQGKERAGVEGKGKTTSDVGETVPEHWNGPGKSPSVQRQPPVALLLPSENDARLYRRSASMVSGVGSLALLGFRGWRLGLLNGRGRLVGCTDGDRPS